MLFWPAPFFPVEARTVLYYALALSLSLSRPFLTWSTRRPLTVLVLHAVFSAPRRNFVLRVVYTPYACTV